MKKGQLTGYKDKNNKEIAIGREIIFDDGLKMTVEYGEEDGVYVISDNDSRTMYFDDFNSKDYQLVPLSNTRTDMSEQQLLGYVHGRDGYGLRSLIDAMGLTKKEWKILREEYSLSYLTTGDIKEINNIFKIKS